MTPRYPYWQHRSGNRMSDLYYDDPSLLLTHNDVYYEDFFIARPSPSPMILRTVGIRHCSPDYHFDHMTFGGRYAMLFIIDGEGYVDGISVTSGSIVFFNRRRLCNFSTNPEKLCSYGWVTFVDGNSDEIVDMIGLSNKNYIYRTDNIDEIARVFYEMLYVKHEGQNKELYMESCLLRLLSLSECSEGRAEDTSDAVYNRHLNSALQYISSNFRNIGFRISEVSAAVGVSENYLRTMFREKMGISIRDYITQQRINIAVNLLKTSNYNINEIARFCGYNDYRQFSEQFKKRKGVSPSKFKSK